MKIVKYNIAENSHLHTRAKKSKSVLARVLLVGMREWYYDFLTERMNALNLLSLSWVPLIRRGIAIYGSILIRIF